VQEGKGGRGEGGGGGVRREGKRGCERLRKENDEERR